MESKKNKSKKCAKEGCGNLRYTKDRRSICLKCIYQKNKKYQKKYRLEKCDWIKKYNKKYCQENRDLISKKRKKRYQKNIDLYKKYNKKYRHSMYGFLVSSFCGMKARVEGRTTNSKKYPHLWIGKSILPKETFLEWSRNHPDFLRIFKCWTNNNYERKLTPSVNRINSNKGYTLDNMEWVTISQNSIMANATRKMKSKQVIYRLLGVK